MAEPTDNGSMAAPVRLTPGSAAYYTVRFAASARRSDLATIFSWHQHLTRITDECRDPGVARLRLDWWRQELARGLAGEHQHPLTPMLAKAISRHGLPPAEFLRAAEAVEADILRTGYAEIDDLAGYAERAFGSVLSLAVRVCAAPDSGEIRTAEALGGIVRLVQALQDFGHDLRRQRCYLPRTLLTEQGLSPETLSPHAPQLPLRAALRALAAEIRRRHTLARAGIRPSSRATLAPALGIAAISMATLKEIERADFAVIQQRIALTPLRTLWTAWRAQS